VSPNETLRVGWEEHSRKPVVIVNGIDEEGFSGALKRR
jgi:hypothetical protein